MNKQALTEALARLESEIELHRDDEYNPGFVAWLEDQSFICAAARLVERLLPEIRVHSHGADCWCDLTESGEVLVWDEGIVEAVAKAIWNGMGFTREIKPVEGSPCFDAARAVLSALVGLLTEKVET